MYYEINKHVHRNIYIKLSAYTNLLIVHKNADFGVIDASFFLLLHVKTYISARISNG